MNRIPALRFSLPIAVLAVVILVGAVWLGMPGQVTPAPGSPELSISRATDVRKVAPVVGAYAPNFTADDLDGRRLTLNDFRGQVVLLNFWTTW